MDFLLSHCAFSAISRIHHEEDGACREEEMSTRDALCLCLEDARFFSSERGEEDPAKGSENADLGILSAHFCLCIYADCFPSHSL